MGPEVNCLMKNRCRKFENFVTLSFKKYTGCKVETPPLDGNCTRNSLLAIPLPTWPISPLHWQQYLTGFVWKCAKPPLCIHVCIWPVHMADFLSGRSVHYVLLIWRISYQIGMYSEL